MKAFFIIGFFFVCGIVYAQPVDDDDTQGLPTPVINDKPPMAAIWPMNIQFESIETMPVQFARVSNSCPNVLADPNHSLILPIKREKNSVFLLLNMSHPFMETRRPSLC